MCDFNDGLNRVNNLLIHLHDNDPVIFWFVVFSSFILTLPLVAAIIQKWRRDNNY